VGFALFAIPSVGGSYWKTFFPAVLVLGFGLAVTVAPLTTIVMSSVDQNRVGSASGINNAVARLAGVLAVAMLGIVMVDVFAYRLNQNLTNLSLSPTILNEVRANVTKLAGLQLPTGLDPATQAALTGSIKQAFLLGFRVVLLICAGLSAASAAVAWFLIRSNDSRGTERVFSSAGRPKEPENG
jgi:hypothetical protein